MNQDSNPASPVEDAKVVYAPAFFADDEAFVRALREGHRGARAAFFDRFADHVERVLVRVLGVDNEIPDLVQEVFLRAYSGFDRFRGDVDALKPWVTRIAVFTARGCIRRRQARRWMRMSAPSALPEVPSHGASPELGDVLRRASEVMNKLPAAERIPFALRFVDDMELAEVASACDVSVATIKRRLGRARKRFERLAARDPVLIEWLRDNPEPRTPDDSHGGEP